MYNRKNKLLIVSKSISVENDKTDINKEINNTKILGKCK